MIICIAKLIIPFKCFMGVKKLLNDFFMND
jgi:hypothetical protein